MSAAFDTGVLGTFPGVTNIDDPARNVHHPAASGYPLEPMDEYRKANRELWDKWTEVHVGSRFYDVDAFRAGASSLQPIERQALGDVQGKSLLHLQCHFGLDTLSWARLGARATGTDLSPRAIDVARSLSAELEVPAEFVACDLYELPSMLDDEFDIVFTSYGVLWWLADLPRWGEIVASFLRPGGLFYIVEFHPMLTCLSDDGTKLEYEYFRGDAPLSFEDSGTYAEPDAPVRGRSYGWPYPLGEVVSALAGAGLRIDELREMDFSPYDCFPFTEPDGPGRFVAPGLCGKLPHVFSIRATKPALPS